MKETSPKSLKKKAMFCSTQAATISIAVHLVLLLFAGSWVALRIAQNRAGAFKGQNVGRPRLECRQLQMPVKLKNLQKKSRRPKVTTRMASAAPSSFSLPDMSKLGKIGDMGFNREGGEGGSRDLSSLGSAGSLGFGISGVNFFGAKSKGEKFVFIVQASANMVTDEKGGYFTYKFVKRRIHEMISRMRGVTLFNVMLYTRYGVGTAMLSDKLIPASKENKQALKDWIAPINADPNNVGNIQELVNYQAPYPYETPMEGDATEWLHAVQAAMEQGADNIFILCANWGQHPIDSERAKKMFDLDEDRVAQYQKDRGWGRQRIKDYEDEVASLREEAEEALEEENEAREEKDLPPKIIADWWTYQTKDLGQKMPEPPPKPPQRHGYELEEILEHMDGVYTYNYVPKKKPAPRIFFVYLVAADDSTASDSEDVRKLQTVVKEYRGDVEFLRGAHTVEDILKNNRGLDKK